MKFTKLFLVIITVISGTSGSIICCPPGQVIIKPTNKCWDPKTSEKTENLLSKTCEHVFGPTLLFSVENNTMELHLPSGNNVTIPSDQFCVANGTSRFDVDLKEIKLFALLCVDEKDASFVSKDTILAYCSIVTAVFLVVTVIIYISIPELRDVQGKSIINFCSSLAISLCMLAVMILSRAMCEESVHCAIRGYLTYFFILGAFFWTNAISVQILLSTRRPVSLDYSWREFKWYMMYAWGCPALLTLIIIIVNYHPGDHDKPEIGLTHSWFYTTHHLWIYLYSFMTLLLVINIGIFIYTSVVIWRTSFSSNHVKAIKYKILISAKLILIMGLPWVFEMISSTVDTGHILMTIIDVLNTLQGVFIFLLLVVFRRRVIKLMHQRGWLSCVSSAVERHLALQDDEEHEVEHTNINSMTLKDTIVQH